jgi:hypothetical protein
MADRHYTSPEPVDIYDHNALRAALIGAKASMESAAAVLDRLGEPIQARKLRGDAELAQAALDRGGDGVLDLLAARERAPRLAAA